MSGDNGKNGAETATNAAEVTYPLYHDGVWYAVPARLRADLETVTDLCGRLRAKWARTGDRAPYAEAQSVQAHLFERVKAESEIIPPPVRA